MAVITSGENYAVAFRRERIPTVVSEQAAKSWHIAPHNRRIWLFWPLFWC